MPESNCSQFFKKGKIQLMLVKNQPHPDISDWAENVQMHPALFIMFPFFKGKAWGEPFIQKLLGTAAPREDLGAFLAKSKSRKKEFSLL